MSATDPEYYSQPVKSDKSDIKSSLPSEEFKVNGSIRDDDGGEQGKRAFLHQFHSTLGSLVSVPHQARQVADSEGGKISRCGLSTMSVAP